MITSLHSSHVETVEALLGSRGVKARKETGTYVIESLQNIESVLTNAAEQVQTLYYTAEGLSRLTGRQLHNIEMLEVSPEVMKAMTDTVTPQGLLAIARIPNRKLETFQFTNKKVLKIAYFWQIQDPGNAGTVVRAADAFGFDAVCFSPESVDVYSPKVVRSTAGSLWQLPVFEEVSTAQIQSFANQNNCHLFAADGQGDIELKQAVKGTKDMNSIWIFGNEARGLPNSLIAEVGAKAVRIPISERVESLNLATAAAVVMYAASDAEK
ncbi:MAG: RNA methyltransferase [Candidatus Nanopelagicaceae bacterium]|nr:RNA methyltransferase [Candidatus Nanopelagicaceae bacterium]